VAGSESQGPSSGARAGVRPGRSDLKIAEGAVWVDGEILPYEQATVPIADPALQSGMGVFETLAVRDGSILDLDAHLERLWHTAGCLGVELPGRDPLVKAARTIAGQLGDRFGWIKIQAVRGGHCAVFSGAMDPAERGRSVTAVLLPWRRHAASPLGGLKTLNYAAFALGLEEARRRGADEGLWLNHRGHLAEGCASNVFVIRHRKIFTPSLRDGILPGVTRSLALEAAAKLKLIVHEGKLRLPRLREADEAFLTSSVRGVRPLIEFDGRMVGSGEPGDITKEIATIVGTLRQTTPAIPSKAPDPKAMRAGQPAGETR
jgi:branched-chain amino acid aminotransferase